MLKAQSKHFIVKLKKKYDHCVAYPKIVPFYWSLFTKNVPLYYKVLIKQGSSLKPEEYKKKYTVVEKLNPKDESGALLSQENSNQRNELSMSIENILILNSKPSLEYLCKLRALNSSVSIIDKDLLKLTIDKINQNLSIVLGSIHELNLICFLKAEDYEKIEENNEDDKSFDEKNEEEKLKAQMKAKSKDESQEDLNSEEIYNQVRRVLTSGRFLNNYTYQSTLILGEYIKNKTTNGLSVYSKEELLKKGIVAPELSDEAINQLNDLKMRKGDYIRQNFRVDIRADKTIVRSKLFPQTIRFMSIDKGDLASLMEVLNVLNRHNPKSIILYQRNPLEFNSQVELMELINSLNKSNIGNTESAKSSFNEGLNFTNIKDYLDNLDKDIYSINIKERIVEKLSNDSHGHTSIQEKNSYKKFDLFNSLILVKYLNMNKNKDFDISFGKQPFSHVVKDIISQDDPSKFFSYLKSFSLLDKLMFLTYYKNCPRCKDQVINTPPNKKYRKNKIETESEEEDLDSYTDDYYQPFLNPQELFDINNMKSSLHYFGDSVLKAIQKYPNEKMIVCLVPEQYRNISVDLFLENFKYPASYIKKFDAPQQPLGLLEKYKNSQAILEEIPNSALHTFDYTKPENQRNLKQIFEKRALSIVRYGLETINDEFKSSNPDQNELEILNNKLGLCALFCPEFMVSSEFKIINQKLNGAPLKYYNLYFKSFNLTDELEYLKLKKDFHTCIPKKLLLDQYVDIENKQRLKQIEALKELEKTLLTLD